jgi:hypothetical protein
MNCFGVGEIRNRTVMRKALTVFALLAYLMAPLANCGVVPPGDFQRSSAWAQEGTTAGTPGTAPNGTSEKNDGEVFNNHASPSGSPSGSQNAGSEPVAGPNGAQSAADSNSAESAADDLKFYAMLNTSSPVPREWKGWVKDHRIKLGFRPMLQWHFWANKRKPFLPSLLFIFLFSVVVSCLAPKLLTNAQVQGRQKFWASFFTGALAVAIVLWLVRVSVLSQFGWPMGVVLSGSLQFSLMTGVGVISSLIGQNVGQHMGVHKLSAREDVRRFAELLIGAIICAALLQLPGIAGLPRIGTRLVGLIAVLGFGALCRTKLAYLNRKD